MNRSVIPAAPLRALPIRARSPKPRGRALARALTVIAALSITLGAAVVAALPGQASVIVGAITSITTSATQVQQYDRVDLDCTWAVPDGSQPGDTFTMQLPSQLRWYGSSTFPLKSPDGQTVAIAQAASNGLVTFALTSYVLTHSVNVHGTCMFSTQYFLATTGKNVILNFTVGAQVIPLEVGTGAPCTQGCPPAHNSALKTMWWTDGRQQSTGSRIEAPPTTADVSTVTLTDTPGPGLAIDCTSVAPAIGRTLDSDGHVVQPGDAVRHPAKVVCTPASLKVAWTGLPAGEYTEVALVNTVTDPTLASYSNSGTVTVNGVISPVGSHLARTDGGGTGVGSTPTPTTTSPTTTPPTTTPSTTAPPTTTTPPTATAPVTADHATPTTTQAPVQTVSATAGPTPGGPAATAPTLAFTGAATVPSFLVALLLVGLGGAALALHARVERPGPRGPAARS
ncbi:Ig-like domain-containing protein [Pedococcus sp.]|uniref:Ig-like domain-containing protein n=1 Tax=Pedococcus sp. TaxID=2860345 RepID=UPI002E0D92D1|nr:Ig-like domain-containing protein [Pedococcus sp.]